MELVGYGERLVVGVIDVQRGFTPAEEGERLGLEGFGELPVPHAEEVVEPINRLLAALALKDTPKKFVFTTQDWHKEPTAHFSDNPDFVNSWPRHCVAGELGAALHPKLLIPLDLPHEKFYKGYERLREGEEDLSYSGYYAVDLDGVEALGDRGGYYAGSRLRDRLYPEDKVILTGVALEKCLGLTALDLRIKKGMDVTVALDATRPITEEGAVEMLRRFEEAGVTVSDTETLIAQYLEA